MNRFSEKTIIRILLLTLLVVFTIESKSQLFATDRILLPFVNFKANEVVIKNIDNNWNNESGYLDRGILILKENLNLCQDIVSGNPAQDSIKNQKIIDNTKKYKTTADTIVRLKNKSTTKSDKKRYKNYRNFPGNIQSQI
jgi:hypothetical protein